VDDARWLKPRRAAGRNGRRQTRHSNVLFGRGKLLIVVNRFNVLASRHELTSTPLANYNDDGFVCSPMR
jgi:hypothetical protein